MSTAVAVVGLLLTLTLLVWPARPAADPLTSARWQHRLLVVIAEEGHPMLLAQRRIAAGHRTGFAERDLFLVEGVGGGAEARALRERFGTGAGGFRAVLVGKDGGAKITVDEPLGAEQLFATIDAMPMRQDEMRGR